MSHYAKKEIASELHIERTKISAVYESCDHARFHPLQVDRQALKQGLVTNYGLSTSYILSIASSHPHKNLEGLVRAYALLVKEHGVEHQLVLVGHKRKAYANILELIDDLDLQGRVLLTGFVPDADIPSLYSLADLFVFPSFYEGFGIPPLEAMACGTPVISSNVASLPEVVGDAACLVDPHDIPALANSMLRVLKDADLRSALVQRGLNRANQFSWEKTARETLAVYKMVTARSNKDDHQPQI
jgi:glycosyltransferase involved in cell wall biosynthesis